MSAAKRERSAKTPKALEAERVEELRVRLSRIRAYGDTVRECVDRMFHSFEAGKSDPVLYAEICSWLHMIGREEGALSNMGRETWTSRYSRIDGTKLANGDVER